MTGRNRGFFVWFVTLLFCVSLVSCVGQKPPRSQTLTPKSLPPDAAADTALGTLPSKEKTEARKQVEAIEASGETEATLEEVQRRKQQEEEERLRHSVTTYDIAERQTQG